jgi:hypothetical protein
MAQDAKPQLRSLVASYAKALLTSRRGRPAVWPVTCSSGRLLIRRGESEPIVRQAWERAADLTASPH